MSDDGEPAGTAGKPILEVIRGTGTYGCPDRGHPVFRRYAPGDRRTGKSVYTGGSGGLSHAGILRKVQGVRLRIVTDYTGLGKIQYILAQRDICIRDTVYTDRVEILAEAALMERTS